MILQEFKDIVENLYYYAVASAIEYGRNWTDLHHLVLCQAGQVGQADFIQEGLAHCRVRF